MEKLGEIVKRLLYYSDEYHQLFLTKRYFSFIVFSIIKFKNVYLVNVQIDSNIEVLPVNPEYGYYSNECVLTSVPEISRKIGVSSDLKKLEVRIDKFIYKVEKQFSEGVSRCIKHNFQKSQRTRWKGERITRWGSDGM